MQMLAYRVVMWLDSISNLDFFFLFLTLSKKHVNPYKFSQCAL